MSQTIASFHEVRFPAALARGAVAGPARSTEIVLMGSGHEQRNARWAESRRQYNVGYGVKTLQDLNQVLDFFEARRGRLIGFRFRDPTDHRSCGPAQTPSNADQLIGAGDGTTAQYQLTKTYGDAATGYVRKIRKPVDGTVQVSVDAQPVAPGDFSVDPATGVITFEPGSIPASGAAITAGFEFDVPVRFDTDEIAVNLSAFEAGDISAIPLKEILV